MCKQAEVKTGEEVLDRFFADLSGLEGVSPEVAAVLSSLHRSGSINKNTILAGLSEARRKRARECEEQRQDQE